MKLSPFAAFLRRSKPATSTRTAPRTAAPSTRSGQLSAAEWHAGAKAVVASTKADSPYKHLDDTAETQQSKQIAEKIIDAGKKARGEEFAPPPKPGSTAAKILDAGRRRRGETF